MNSTEIVRRLYSDHACEDTFAGVFAANELPQLVDRKPRIYIANTDLSTGFGLHWVAFFFPKDGVAEFFDSVGKSPETYHASFRNFLTNNGSSYKFLKVRLQDFQTNTCGHYCIFYVKCKCQGWSLERVLEFFNGQPRWKNDKVLRDLFSV